MVLIVLASKTWIKRFRQTQWAADQKKIDQQRGSIIASPKPEIDAMLKKAMDGDGTRSLAMRIFSLLEHLYTEHPPLHPSLT